MLTRRRARILPDRTPPPAPPQSAAAAPPPREERRPAARDGFTPIYGRASGWYFRRERGR